MIVLPACIPVYHMCLLCPRRSEEGIRCPATKVTEVGSSRRGSAGN